MDTLGSWNDTATRRAIIEFVQRVTTEGGADYVPPEERIATFDNDGTLWCEKPMQIQLDFTVRRFVEQARDDPSLRERQPWKAAAEQDLHWLGGAVTKHYHGDDSDLKVLFAAVEGAFESVPVEEYDRRVADFFRSASHPTLQRPYNRCGYQPMIELLRYLEANGFTTYIASGGDRDFMRPVAGDMYDVPPERVIGSALGLSYRDDTAELIYEGAIEFFDDGPTKPMRIWSRVGRRPIIAAGNANGDLPMLKYTGGPSRPALRLVLLHDDAEREFEYDSGAEELLESARGQGWTVVSIKDDWASVFGD
jgi:phosphoglycolate phosphatase-like HAD superfamily hydrolase